MYGTIRGYHVWLGYFKLLMWEGQFLATIYEILIFLILKERKIVFKNH